MKEKQSQDKEQTEEVNSKVTISPETMKSMAKFFMATSVPKMVDKLREERKKEEDK